MVALVAAAAGCATPTYPTYRSSAVIGVNAISSHGITVTVDPFFDKDRCKRYFGFSQEDGRLVIIHISARNTTRDRSFHLLKKNIRLLASGSAKKRAPEEGKIARSTAVGEGVAMAGTVASIPFPLIGLPVQFGGQQVIADQTAVRNNLVNQELQEGTVSPGQTLEGFVYYLLPEKQPRMKSGTIVVTLLEAGSGGKIDFPFEINR